MRMSTLFNLYKKEGPSVFDRLHNATGANPKYLYQIATGKRRPSADLAKILIDAEPYLTLEGLLYPDQATNTKRTDK